MNGYPRRAFVLGLAALGSASACGNGVGGSGARELDARVEAARELMIENVAGSRELLERSTGILVIPAATEVGLVLGGGYGRGALQIHNATVDYYSLTKGTAGLFAGGHQYAHTLFFMTEHALAEFRRSSGWAAGGGIEYTALTSGLDLSFDTTRSLTPVISLVYGRAGLIAGASVEGIKYTRIIP